MRRTAVKIPKMLSVAKMRSILGDAEVERIVVAVHADQVLPAALRPATPEQITAGADLINGESSRGKSSAASRGFLSFFSANPRLSKKYLVWAKGQLAPSENGESEETIAEEAPKRRRRRTAKVA